MARICPLIRISTSSPGGPVQPSQEEDRIVSTGKLAHAVLTCRLVNHRCPNMGVGQTKDMLEG